MAHIEQARLVPNKAELGGHILGAVDYPEFIHSRTLNDRLVHNLKAAGSNPALGFDPLRRSAEISDPFCAYRSGFVQNA
ncbi:MAG TPA: hypothetical protein VMV87_03095 [Burkholderiales bacterium]|nr:hypothetical protein [Burkholderiales bacterium]